MAKTITQLPDATAVNAADEMIIQQSGITKRASISELKTEVAALGANDITVSTANRSITNTGNFALSFGTNNTERVRIDNSGNVGIGTTSPNAAALLDVTSTTQGFLPPRMTEAERDAISTPPAGLMAYNTTTDKLNFYNGTAWEAVTSS